MLSYLSWLHLHQHQLSLWWWSGKCWVYSSLSSSSPGCSFPSSCHWTLLFPLSRKVAAHISTHTLLSLYSFQRSTSHSWFPIWLLQGHIRTYWIDLSFMILNLKCSIYHNFHCSPRFLSPDSYVYYRKEVSFCSAEALLWLLTNKLYLEGISSPQPDLWVSRDGLIIAPMLVQVNHLFGKLLLIWFNMK